MLFPDSCLSFTFFPHPCFCLYSSLCFSVLSFPFSLPFVIFLFFSLTFYFFLFIFFSSFPFSSLISVCFPFTSTHSFSFSPIALSSLILSFLFSLPTYGISVSFPFHPSLLLLLFPSSFPSSFFFPLFFHPPSSFLTSVLSHPLLFFSPLLTFPFPLCDFLFLFLFLFLSCFVADTHYKDPAGLGLMGHPRASVPIVLPLQMCVTTLDI